MVGRVLCRRRLIGLPRSAVVHPRFQLVDRYFTARHHWSCIVEHRSSWLVSFVTISGSCSDEPSRCDLIGHVLCCPHLIGLSRSVPVRPRFLIGPRRQCTKMCHKKRRIACVAYLVLLILVIVLAFIVSNRCFGSTS